MNSKYFTPAFSSRYGSCQKDREDLTQNLPQIYSGVSVINIDLTPLLIFDKMRMDASAYHQILISDEPALQVLSKTLKHLRDRELIEPFDANHFSQSAKTFIREEVSKAKSNHEEWISQVRNCISAWNTQRGEFRESYTGSLAESRKIPFLVQGTLINLGLPINLENCSEMLDHIFAEHQLTADRRLVQQTAIQVAAEYVGSLQVWNADASNGPVLDWDNLDKIAAWNETNNFQRKFTAQQIETASIMIQQHSDQPSSQIETEKFADFLVDPIVTEFRQYVAECVNDGLDIEILKKEEDNQNYAANNIRRLMRLPRAFLAPVFGGLSELIDLAGSLGIPTESISKVKILESSAEAMIGDQVSDALLSVPMSKRINVRNRITKHFG